MRFYRLTISLIALALLVTLSDAPVAFGQDSGSTQAQDTAQRTGIRNVASGQKAKVKGRIVRRDAETFSVRDEQDNETIVRLTDRTSVKTKGGFLRSGKNYDVTSLLRGLIVEVEGRGNQEGQVVADKIRFNSSDLKVAQTVEARVTPVERESQRLSGQVDELNEVSKATRAEADRANAGVVSTNERISAIDDYVVQDTVPIFFNVNSAVISAQDKQALDALAQKAVGTKGYVIEITGHADASGNAERNRVLSQQRADAVVRYLQENHEIPLRRIVTPFGYGQMKPVADNNTPEGRRQNRRVEVKILVSRGMAQTN